jgi:hypothetical protein
VGAARRGRTRGQEGAGRSGLGPQKLGGRPREGGGLAGRCARARASDPSERPRPVWQCAGEGGGERQQVGEQQAQAARPKWGEWHAGEVRAGARAASAGVGPERCVAR